MTSITLRQPDDWHCHLRDGDVLSRTVPDTAQQFARAIVMPNLVPPITTLKQAHAYQQRILEQVPTDCTFTPLMTLYLTEQLNTGVLCEGKKSGLITACKLYPAGATTHSSAGIRELSRIYPLLACMEEIDLPLLIHGESIDPQCDIFDREARFIEEALIPLLKQFPNLRVVLEHITTKTAVDFVRESSAKLAATITPHHLWCNRNDLLAGGIRPHLYCLPILKRRNDQEALIQAATSGHRKFFLGTDSAPHAQSHKQSTCGCAGIYSAHAAIELYAQIFDQHNALNQLESFASINGAEFYGLPLNTTQITLKKNTWTVPNTLSFGKEKLTPFQAGNPLEWQL